MLVALPMVGLALAAAQSPAAVPSALEQAEQLQAEIARKPGEISRSEAEAALANCGIRRFETSAEGVIEGRMRRTSIRLCAADSESAAEWLSKLEKALAQVDDQQRLPPDVKLKLQAELRAEIARLQQLRPASANPIPPRPSLIVAQPPATDTRAADAPTPVSPPVAAAATPRAPTVVVRKPRLDIRCSAPGDPSGGGRVARPPLPRCSAAPRP